VEKPVSKFAFQVRALQRYIKVNDYMLQETFSQR
jgi:hypothetical protein